MCASSAEGSFWQPHNWLLVHTSPQMISFYDSFVNLSYKKICHFSSHIVTDCTICFSAAARQRYCKDRKVGWMMGYGELTE